MLSVPVLKRPTRKWARKQDKDQQAHICNNVCARLLITALFTQQNATSNPRHPHHSTSTPLNSVTSCRIMGTLLLCQYARVSNLKSQVQTEYITDSESDVPWVRKQGLLKKKIYLYLLEQKYHTQKNQSKWFPRLDGKVGAKVRAEKQDHSARCLFNACQFPSLLNV